MRPIVRVGGHKMGRTSTTRLARLTQDCSACEIQVIESVPCPHDLQARIEHDHHVADNVGEPRPLKIRDHLLDRCEHDDIAVRQTPGFVVKYSDLALTEIYKLCIHGSCISFLNCVAGD